ncbi:murein biosynthesis integral membrane protein MurJ [Candidatus Pelagibacter sp. Uisw_134_02]|jgi:putative peptidoglycan lipid II flippase|uniref:murein biosynthesis integral membrane protein MurJ n=1 Tax=Candidatus Pelagibacter sp. Uisw_134_02 TaxID=3230990 RepID=UPI0039ED4166
MNLIKSTGTFSFFTIISRLLGYVRDILIAMFLGTGPLADAFFVAFRIPNTFRRLFSEGTFNAAFVPSYSSLLNNKKKSQNFANNIFNLLTAGLFFLVLIIEIFMPLFVFLIAPGFDGDYQKMELAITLTRVTFPFLLFISLSSFFSAILNSHNKFAIASAAPIILNILLIGVLFLGKILNDQLVYYLSYAVTISGILQFIFLYFFVKRYFYPEISFSFKIDNKIKNFFKKLLPSIFSSGVTQINILVGTIIASFQASAVSYLYYADRIYQINLAIAGIAIGTVILPQLSKHVKSGKKEKIKLIQNKALELSLFLSIPAAIALLVASEEIISSLFGYGSFDEPSVKNSAKALFYFAIGLPAFSLIKVFSTFFFARHNTKTPFYISLTSVLLNIFISLVFFKEIGFIIIPIATTISSWFNAILLFTFLKIKNLFYFNLVFINRFIKIFLASILMGIFFNCVIHFFNEKLLYEANFKAAYLIGAVVLGLIFYLLIAILIKAFKRSDINLNY